MRDLKPLEAGGKQVSRRIFAQIKTSYAPCPFWFRHLAQAINEAN